MGGIITVIGDLNTWLGIVETEESLEEKEGWNMREIKISEKGELKKVVNKTII